MSDAQSAQDDWTDVGSSPLFKWDVAQSLQGEFLGEVRSDSKYGQKKYAVKKADGETVEFFAPSVLNRLLSSAEVQPGFEVLITYTGKTVTTSTGRAAKEFDVKVRPAA